MYWTKVIIYVIYSSIYVTCHPLPPYSKPLHLNKNVIDPVRSKNSAQELSREVYSILNGKLRNRQYPLRTFDNGRSIERINSENKNEMKRRRGLDVGILVDYPTTKHYDSALEKLEDMLANDLSNRLVEKKFNESECPSCDEEEVIIQRTVKPAYKCDEWDPKHRVCILERNIGDTVTFYLSIGKNEGMHHPNVTWKKEFHMRDSTERKEFDIDAQNPPENIIIGRKGYELRLSPITETDISYNMFSATLQTHSTGKLYFMIRIVPIDMGFVYVGETIELNLRKFVSLPEKSMSFKWYMEKDGEHGTLPSNMKVSLTGSSIKISELRQEQEGILACSVYTNLHILATKKRFLIKDLSKNKDVLQSSPNHSLVFKEEFREKRVPKSLDPYFSSLRLSRKKRARLAVEEVERALLQASTTEQDIPNYTTIPPPYNNPYNKMQHEEPGILEENENRFQEISDNAENLGNFPENRQIDISIYKEPPSVQGSVQGQRGFEKPQPINGELSFQAGVPVNAINIPDTKPLINQPEILQMNDVPGDRRFFVQPGNGLLKPPQQYIMNNVQHKNVPNIMQNVPTFDISVNPPLSPNAGQNKENILPVNQKDYQNGAQYIDVDVQAKGLQPSKPKVQENYSDIVLNIGEQKEHRKITTEMHMAKLISYCFSDFECSVTAVCVRNNLKTAGFCKCLPGTNGIGIFCREEVWLSKSNFDIEEHNSDYVAYSNTSPTE